MANTSVVMTKAKVAEELEASEAYVDWLLEEGYLVASFLPSRDGVRDDRNLRIQRLNFRQFISNITSVPRYKSKGNLAPGARGTTDSRQRTLQQAQDEANSNRQAQQNRANQQITWGAG